MRLQRRPSLPALTSLRFIAAAAVLPGLPKKLASPSSTSPGRESARSTKVPARAAPKVVAYRGFEKPLRQWILARAQGRPERSAGSTGSRVSSANG